MFEEVAPLICSVADSYNAVIFAYGQTGSGKTFTMQGTAHEPGCSVRALQVWRPEPTRSLATLAILACFGSAISSQM